MKKIKKILTIISAIIALLTLNLFNITTSVQAASIREEQIKSLGLCGDLLKYKGVTVLVNYAQYEQNGISYPAYCLDRAKPGVTNELSYNVNVEDAITDVKLWRYVVNGYPYKTLEELGCQTKEEAFTATKQAIYCYIHGNNPNDYQAIGEAGQRTLNALKKIVQAATSSQETKISSNIKVNKQATNFAQDNLDKNYVSKTYSTTAGATTKKYKVILEKIEKDLPEGIKITDENNNEKQEFNQNEKFKILIPVQKLKEDGSFKIKIETQIKTKPVLYGRAINTEYQDYALTTATYEDAKGESTDYYYKNDTYILIIKQNKNTEERLEGVEFELLNENKEVVHTNLKTDKEGKIIIENIVPGKYYLRETTTLDGYILYEKLIEVVAKLNQKVTVTVNNTKTERVEITNEEKEQEVQTEEKNEVVIKESSSKEILAEQEITQTIKEDNTKDITVEQNVIQETIEVQNIETEVQTQTVIKKLPKTGM